MLSLLTVDIIGLIAALSIWTASFLLMLAVGSEPTGQHEIRR
jgi:hypothetical protein